MQRNRRTSFGRQLGFSIVELMVAILIGLIILAGAIQVVINSKTTFLGQEDMAYIQENARYAVDVLSKDIQSSGYWGCAGKAPRFALVGNVAAGDLNAKALFDVLPVESPDGFPIEVEDKIELWNPPNTSGADHMPESFIVRRTDGEIFSVVDNAGKLTVNTATDLEEGDYVAVIAEDCRRVGVVQLSEVSGTELQYKDAVCTDAIKPTVLSESYTCDDAGSRPIETYLPGSTVMEYKASAYFIGESSVLPGQPALKRIHLKSSNAAVEEVALGVEDMQVLYGLREGSGTLQYFTAAEMSAGAKPWQNVISMQVNLVFRSRTTSATGTISTESFLGNIYGDRFIRRLITSTIQLKNRA